VLILGRACAGTSYLLCLYQWSQGGFGQGGESAAARSPSRATSQPTSDGRSRRAVHRLSRAAAPARSLAGRDPPLARDDRKLVTSPPWAEPMISKKGRLVRCANATPRSRCPSLRGVAKTRARRSASSADKRRPRRQHLAVTGHGYLVINSPAAVLGPASSGGGSECAVLRQDHGALVVTGVTQLAAITE
jgi:hypothetical protein